MKRAASSPQPTPRNAHCAEWKSHSLAASRKLCLGRYIGLQKAAENGQSHQIWQRGGLHLPHDVGPSQFDGSQTDIEIGGDSLVRMAGQQSPKGFPLVFGERSEPLMGLQKQPATGVLCLLQVESLLDGRPQLFLATRLFEECRGTR